MTTNQWLRQSEQQLSEAGIGTARLDCLVLLADCLHKNQAQVLAAPDLVLSVEQQNWLARRLLCRVDHEPLAYIRGFTEFYGRQFIINPDVLEPRPESETMIDLLKSLIKPEQVIDVGTGSGALAITAGLEIPKTEVVAVDIDPKCLSIAKQNIAKYNVLIKSGVSDLLSKVTVKKNAVLLANLPYVPNDYQVNQAAMLEPKVAIFGGADGLDLYRKLFKQIDKLKVKPAHILTESLPFQHQALAALAKLHSYNLIKTEDFIQVFWQNL